MAPSGDELPDLNAVIGKTIERLRLEIARIDHAIEALKSIRGDSLAELGDIDVNAHRRGRKSMSQEERLTVSERMRRYWANRREKKP